jgi:hypothetical protein
MNTNRILNRKLADLEIGKCINAKYFYSTLDMIRTTLLMRGLIKSQEDYFYYDSVELKSLSGWSLYNQRKILKLLVEAGIVIKNKIKNKTYVSLVYP